MLPGDEPKPNTPKHKVNFSASYVGAQGLDFRIGAKCVDGHDWASGVFVGRIPSSQTVDLTVGYRINESARLRVMATNVLDQ